MNATAISTPIAMPGPVIGSLCTGIAGLDLGCMWAIEGRLAWVADPDPDVRTVLAARAPGVPNLGDISRVEWQEVEPVDLLTAGFPCQDISSAGQRAGIKEGTRSGLWYRVMDAVRGLRPALVFVENVAALRWRGGDFGIVLGQLAQAGYDACWCSVRAADVGAPHRRERVFVLAWPARHASSASAWHATGGARHDAQPQDLRDRPSRPAGGSGRPITHAPGCSRWFSDRDGALVAHPERCRRDRRPSHPRRREVQRTAAPGNRQVDWGVYEPAILRWENNLGQPAPEPTEAGRNGRHLSPRFVEWMMGYPDGWVTDLDLRRTAQLRALGNAVVPQQAAHALRLLLAQEGRRRSDQPPWATVP